MHNNVYVNKVKASIIQASLDTMDLTRLVDFVCNKQEQDNLDQTDINLLAECLEKYDKSQDALRKTFKTFVKRMTNSALDEVDAIETDNGFQL